MFFFREHLIFIPVVSWLAAIVCKGFYTLYIGKFSVRSALSAGGMPSVHSALVTSLTTSIGIKYGIFSDLFLICLVFATIIIYDAINVRFEAGLHAKMLNKLKATISEDERRLNESIGHLPHEALVGSLLGIAVAIACLNI